MCVCHARVLIGLLEVFESEDARPSEDVVMEVDDGTDVVENELVCEECCDLSHHRDHNNQILLLKAAAQNFI